MVDQQPVDSPVGWVKEHIDDYERSGGEQGRDGHLWRGAPTLLITMTATPELARPRTSSYISAFAATSIPRVGSSKINTRGFIDSHFASTSFC